MKNRFSKLLSVILCVSMILSMAGFSVIAEDTAAELLEVTEYYVKKGGTGDGRSADAPAGTIVDVVTNINADGHAEGDLVTVYVIDSGEGVTCATEGGVIDSDVVVGYNNSAVGQVPAHTATIKYTSYSDEVRSVIGHVNWQGANSNAAHFCLSGPSIFEGIDILDMRNSTNGGTDIYLNGYSAEFIDVKLMDLKGSNQGTVGEVFSPSSTHFCLGGTRRNSSVTRDAVVRIDDASMIGDYLTLTGYTDAGKTQTQDGDVTLYVESGTLGKLYLSNSKGTEVFTGNLNIVLGEGVTVTTFKSDNGSDRPAPVVNGALQIIKNFGVTASVDSAYVYASETKDSNAPVYILTVASEGISLDVTETAGTYDVTGTGYAYVVAESGTTIYYGDASTDLTVPEGIHTVEYASTLDEVKAAANPTSDNSLIKFNGWIDDGEGTLTADFGPVTDKFYVQYGGTGDGLSAESPVATVADAVDVINAAGFTTGDEATIYVMQSADWNYGAAGSETELLVGGGSYPAHHITAWKTSGGRVSAHKATINVTSYDAENPSYLAATGYLGHNMRMAMNGPTNFSDIVLVDMRKGYRGISANGNDVTYGEGTVFAVINHDQYDGTANAWDGVINQSGVVNADIGEEYANSGGPGGTVTFLNAFTANYSGRGVHLPSAAASPYAFTDDVNIVFDNANIETYLYFAESSGQTTIGGNLNIVIKNAKTITAQTRAGTVAVSGAVQNVSAYGAPVIAVPSNVTADGGIWNVVSGTSGLSLDVTDTAGTFAVSGGMTAYAVSADGLNVYYGTSSITLPAGTSTVYGAADLAAVKAEAPVPEVEVGYDFYGWIDDGEGTLSADIDVRIPKTASYYVQWGGTGDGSSINTPLATVDEAIIAANATGEYQAGDVITVYVSDGAAPETLNSETDTEFWKYDASGNYVLGTTVTSKTESRFTIMKSGATQLTYHDFTLVITSADASNPSYVAQHQVFGVNTNITLAGPTVFRNIKYVTNRMYDREIFSNGYDVEFDNVTFHWMNCDTSGGSGTYAGLADGHFKLLISDNDGGTDGTGGTIRLNSTINATGGNYGLYIAGIKNRVQLSAPQKIYFDNENLNLGVYWGGNEGVENIFDAGLSIIANAGTLTSSAKAGSVTVNGGLQVIKNNGTAFMVPSNVTADKTWIVAPTDGTLDVTETAGTFAADTEYTAYFALDSDYNLAVGTVSEEGTITLPEGDFRLYFTNGDAVADDFALARAAIANANISGNTKWTEVSENYYTAEIPKFKHVMKITDAGSGFESNTGSAYSYENTTFYGQTVRKITRTAGNTDDSVRPLIYKYSNIIDETGSTIPVGEVRYISIRYYYESDDETPALEGVNMSWTQGALTDAEGTKISSNWSGVSSAGYTGTAPNTVTANKWSTITIDMHTQSAFLDHYNNNPTYKLQQYKFSFLGAAMPEGDAIYIGDVIFTNYDPAEELAKPTMVFISENGNDENDGSSLANAVKTTDRAYELAANNETVDFIVDGTVYGGNGTTNCPELTATFASAGGTAILSDIYLRSDAIFEDVTLTGTITTNGCDATFSENVSADNCTINVASDTEASGSATVYGGKFASAKLNADSSLIVDGGEVEAVTISSAENCTVTIGYISGNIGSITSDTTVGNLQVLLGDGLEAPEGLDSVTVSDKKITVIPPIMKSSTGKSFQIKATDTFGVFETYSGKDLNFGYGLTTYITYTYSDDGNHVYYSNANTGYKLTLPETSTYQLEVAGEASYTAANGKPITGFAADTHLTLPEGAVAWEDDGKGTFTALYALPETEYKTVYVSNKYGLDTNDGLTAETAVKTLAGAITIIGTTNNGKVIILDGNDAEGNAEYEVYTRSDTNTYGGTQNVLRYTGVPTHTGTITYEGDAVDSVLCFGANHLELQGPSVFKNLTLIEGYNVGKNFVTRGYDCSFEGEIVYYRTSIDGSSTPNAGVKTNTDFELGIDVSGRSTVPGAGTTIITDAAPVVSTFAFGGWDNDLNFGGDQTLVVDSGSVTTVKLRNNSGTWTMKNINIVYNGGTIGSIKDVGAGTASANALQIINNNGLTSSYTATGITLAEGTWIMNSAAEEGSSLYVTETAGIFEVVGDKYAKAVNADGATSYSADGKLVVPAGTWTVTYSDTVPYTFDGTVLTTNTEVSVDLNTLSVVVPENKVFIGWSADEAGTEWFDTASVDFAANENAYAQFVNCASEDIYVLGAQIRITGIQGLRFVNQINKTLLSDLGITQIGGTDVSYGSVVFPSALKGANELVIGLTDGTNTAAKVPAVNTYYETDALVNYTAVLTNITDINYTKDYAIRPYIEYTDKNGVGRVVYGEEYAVSVYDIADYALENDTTLSDTAKTTLEGIVEAAVSSLDAPVEMLYTTATGVSDYASATEEDFAKGAVFYTTESGVKVREIHLTGGTNANAQDTVLGVLTDTHINVVDPVLDKYDPEVQYTNQTRSWCKNGATVSALEKAVEFAGRYDNIAVTGDIIDYLSFGSLEVIKRVMLDPHPDGIYALGGHDVTKNMETGYSDQTSLENRHAILRSYYDPSGNDIIYQSRLVNNNVLMIQLDNGLSKYWEEQVDKLEADIATARENGYIILIFQHEPINTKNSAFDAATIYDGTTTYDHYYDDTRVHQSVASPDAATQAVYDLITTSADVVKGVFGGHIHYATYSEILATDKDGNAAVIPMYINRPNAYEPNSGFVTKVVIDAAN